MVLSWPFKKRVRSVLTSGSITEPPIKETLSISRPTIKTMLMCEWMECMCEDDFSSINNDQDLWIDLVSEYQELKGDSIEAIEVLRLSKEIRRLNNHLFLFDLCIRVLEKRYSVSVADSLNRLGYPFRPVNKIPSEYRNMLQVCINKSKTRYVQLQQAVKQLEAAKPNDKKPTREYYEETLINIEQYQRMSYSMDALTVYKFVLLEKRLTKAVMKQQNARK